MWVMQWTLSAVRIRPDFFIFGFCVAIYAR